MSVEAIYRTTDQEFKDGKRHVKEMHRQYWNFFDTYADKSMALEKFEDWCKTYWFNNCPNGPPEYIRLLKLNFLSTIALGRRMK